MPEKLAISMEEWRRLLGEDSVISQEAAEARYKDSEFGPKKRLLGILVPKNEDHVVALVKIAHAYGIPLHPLSRGHNWGYGGPTPVEGSCVIVDLSHINTVYSFDAKLGLVTVGPGVTVGNLEEYLRKNGGRFMSPVVGIGAHASIIGNALERGLSTTPPLDRFSSIMSVRAVLGDGTVYSSPSKNFFKWGAGPYLDGLFGQSNFGIVTQMTFALAPRAECNEVFFAVIEKGGCEGAVDALRELSQTLGGILASYQIQNNFRVRERVYQRDGLDVLEWLIIGTLQGDIRVVASARHIVRQKLSAAAGSVQFLDAAYMDRLIRLERLLAWAPPFHRLYSLLPLLQSFLSHTTGEWRWLKKFETVPYGDMIFFPLVIPAIGERVQRFVAQAVTISDKYGIVPNIGLLSFSERAVFVSFPLYVTKGDARYKKTLECYKELEKIGSEVGGFIYRSSVHTMQDFIKSEDDFWQVVARIKDALDEKGIISPGRYGPSWR